jgi:hypothetical protein
MKLGFTGTRHGLTARQLTVLRRVLITYRVTEVHHGDCVGADAQLHDLAVSMGLKIVIHPPIDTRLRAFCSGAARTQPAAPYIERNQNIVRATDMTVGCPSEQTEPAPRRGQGTWSTIRFARRNAKLLLWISPSGAVNEQNGTT